MKTGEPSIEDWTRFVNSGLIYCKDSNVNGEFPKLSRQFGLAYIYYLEASFLVKDEMTEDEFCRINGNVPIKFLNKFK